MAPDIGKGLQIPVTQRRIAWRSNVAAGAVCLREMIFLSLHAATDEVTGVEVAKCGSRESVGRIG